MQSRACAVLWFSVVGVISVSPAFGAGTLRAFMGPGDNPSLSIGYRDPESPVLTTHILNDRGTAVGQTDLYMSNSYYAARGFRYGNGVNTPLSTTNNSYGGWAHAINNSGVVAGSIEAYNGSTPAGRRLVRYAANTTTPTVLGTPLTTAGYGWADASEISPNGTIVGSARAFDASGNVLGDRAARWDANSSTAVVLQPLTIDPAGKAVGVASFVNASGMIAGQSSFEPGTIDYGYRAVRYAPGSTTPVELTGPTADSNGKRDASVYGLNDAGITIGSVRQYSSTGTFLGFRPGKWNADSTAFTPLGTLGSTASGYIASAYASAINKNGVIAGNVMKYDSAGNQIGMRPVGWASGTLISANPLGILGIDANTSLPTTANAINDSITIVGTSETYTNVFGTNVAFKHAVAWFKASTQVTDLSALLEVNSPYILQTADAVSNTGWVSGLATYHDVGTDSYYDRLYTMLVPQAGTYGNGDANFDEVVNFDDLIILAQNYNKLNASKSATVGDFNLDGVTNFDDLIILAQHYNQGTPAQLNGLNASFAADWALAQSLVPEPTLLAMLLPLSAMTRRRGR